MFISDADPALQFSVAGERNRGHIEFQKSSPDSHNLAINHAVRDGDSDHQMQTTHPEEYL